MRTVSLGRLVLQSLWRARGSLGLAAFGVAVGIAALAFFLSLSAGLRQTVGEIFPMERIEVVPGGGGGISLFGGGGGAPTIDDDDIEQIRRIEGLEDVQPRMRFGFPVKAWGGEELLNATRYTELIGDGVPTALVDDLRDPSVFGDLTSRSSNRPCKGEEDTSCPRGEYCDTIGSEPKCQEQIPALINPFMLELYNEYLAPGGGLPRMSRWMVDRVRGLTFRVRLGESYMGRASCGGRTPCEPKNVTVKLSGMSRNAVEMGITVPIEYVRRWNTIYAEGDARTGYASLSVRTNDDDDVTAVVAELRRLGYEIPSNRAQQAGITITIITALLALTSGLIIFVAAVNIAHTFFTLVHERRQEIALYRALGATRGDVRNIIMSEAGVVGLVAGVVGLAMARAAAWGCDKAWDTYVPNFPFKPESLFTFTPSLVALALVFAVLCCLFGAYLPARRAARLDPARTLT